MDGFGSTSTGTSTGTSTNMEVHFSSPFSTSLNTVRLYVVTSKKKKSLPISTNCGSVRAGCGIDDHLEVGTLYEASMFLRSRLRLKRSCMYVLCMYLSEVYSI
jgi:hypothetical protein